VPRVQYYIPHLRAQNIEIKEHPSRFGMYPPDEAWKRPGWGICNLLEHVPATIASYKYDLTLIQREMLSTFVTFEPFTKRPRIFDIDDAIWVHRDGNFARRIAQLCDHVICGNQFLADEFSKHNSSVSILPSPVNTKEFFPEKDEPQERRSIIGWMGLHSGFRFLYKVEPALRQVLNMHPKTILQIISDRRPQFRDLPSDQIEFVPWSAESQVRLIQSMTAGIMPLDDTIMSRGKCSYKMLLYMACGVPVVVSPVGMNAEVLQKGASGFGARNTDEWVTALHELICKPEMRRQMGRIGRSVVGNHYSVETLAPKLAATLFQVSGETPYFTEEVNSSCPVQQ
jgi:glycosyltransferase involved in cell wall biosynthesis